MVVKIGVAPQSVEKICRGLWPVWDSNLSLTAIYDSIMFRSDESFKLNQILREAEKALRQTPDQKTG